MKNISMFSTVFYSEPQTWGSRFHNLIDGLLYIPHLHKIYKVTDVQKGEATLEQIPPTAKDYLLTAAKITFFIIVGVKGLMIFAALVVIDRLCHRFKAKTEGEIKENKEKEINANMEKKVDKDNIEDIVEKCKEYKKNTDKNSLDLTQLLLKKFNCKPIGNILETEEERMKKLKYAQTTLNESIPDTEFHDLLQYGPFASFHNIVPDFITLGDKNIEKDVLEKFEGVISVTNKHKYAIHSEKNYQILSKNRDVDVAFDDILNFEVLKECFSFMDRIFQKGGHVLVHCQQGKDRSPFIVIAYLMRTFKLSPDEALKYVRSKRSSVSTDDMKVTGEEACDGLKKLNERLEKENIDPKNEGKGIRVMTWLRYYADTIYEMQQGK